MKKKQAAAELRACCEVRVEEERQSRVARESRVKEVTCQTRDRSSSLHRPRFAGKPVLRLGVKVWCRAPAGTKPRVDTVHVPRSQHGLKSGSVMSIWLPFLGKLQCFLLPVNEELTVIFEALHNLLGLRTRPKTKVGRISTLWRGMYVR